MTGLERLIQKTSNATAAALMGQRPPFVAVGPWQLEELRQEAIEDEERRYHERQEIRRKMIHYGCE